MTLREYYGFPEGINVQMSYASFYTQQDDDYPCPADMTYAFAYQKMTFIKPLNTSNVTNMQYMFYNCSKLKTAPMMDTNNIGSMYYTFYGCSVLTEIPEYNTKNVTDMQYMFYNCAMLPTIPPLNTSKVAGMSRMFYGCSKLTSLPAMDCSSITTKNYYPLYNNSGLTDVGGFTNMKMSWDDSYGLSKCSKLTYESCINILNGLYDFTGNGKTPTSNQGKLKVHANFLKIVGDDLTIGTNKGWTITT